MSTNQSSAESFGTSVAVNWDERVEGWETVAATPAFARLAQLVVAAAAPAPGDRVVDLGAGTGLLSLALAPHVERVVALDLSEPMLIRLQHNALQRGLRNVTTRTADLRTIPLPDESVTLAVSNYAFHHLDDNGKELALAEVRRVLAPGGRLVVCDMMFRLSLAPRDRALIGEMVSGIARRGPSGLFRIAKNVARITTGRWEKPANTAQWEAMLDRRRFSEVSVRVLEREAGLAYAKRPELSGRTPSTHALPLGSEPQISTQDDR